MCPSEKNFLALYLTTWPTGKLEKIFFTLKYIMHILEANIGFSGKLFLQKKKTRKITHIGYNHLMKASGTLLFNTLYYTFRS
jgi:hypothetical protein